MHLVPSRPGRSTGENARPGRKRLLTVAAAVLAATASVAASPAAGPARAADASRSGQLPAGVRRACPVATRPGQMECMTLLRTNTRHYRGVVPHQTPSGYGPASLQSAYNLTTASGGGTGETVAVVTAYGDPNAASDLATYRSQYALPACDNTGPGCLTVENEQGQTSPLPAGNTGWSLADSADLDMVSAICPNCQLLLVEANSNSISDLGKAENTAAGAAHFVANSWNGPEFTTEDSDDTLYFDHPGVAITVAAGESGYGTTWPTTSQFVTAVGGTTLTADSGVSRGWTETAWAGTGSGCSQAEPKPSWQTADDSSPAGCLNRTQNDVAAVGNPNTGVALYDTYVASGNTSGWQVGGGTAVAAPIIAAVYALAGTPAPRTYPASYPYQSGQAANLYAVTSGSNGTCESDRQYLCNAGSDTGGYNGPTGLGTPDGTAAFADSVTGNLVTLADPGVQDEEAGTAVSLAMQGMDSAGKSLTYSAAGLPAGLSIGASTGKITGTLSSSAATSTVTVTAKASGGTTGSVTFSMVVMKSLATDYDGVSGPVDLDLGGKCLDDDNNSTSQGNPVVIYTCNGSAAENWEYKPDGNPGGAGTVTIHGKCMDLKGGSTASETLVVLDTCNGHSSQQWLITGAAGQFESVAAAGKCLDDPGKSTTNGKQVWIYACSGAINQAWIPPASPVQSGVTGMCVDDSRDKTTTGNKVQAWNCNGGASQKWTDEPDETLRLGGHCLTVTGGSLLDGATVVLDPCASPSTSDQHWLIGPSGELVNANSGRCLADPGNSTTDGTALVQQDCYGLSGEIWAVT
jgi:Ricin-type beta-trefoil lectin domain/Putative Ig domain